MKFLYFTDSEAKYELTVIAEDEDWKENPDDYYDAAEYAFKDKKASWPITLTVIEGLTMEDIV